MRKKLVLGTMVLLIITLIMSITAINLNHLTQIFFTRMAQSLAGKTMAGITIETLELPPPTVDITGLTITWPHLTARITLAQDHEWLSGKTIALQIADLQISRDGLFAEGFEVTANAISAMVDSQESAHPTPPDVTTRLDDGTIHLSIHLELWPPDNIRPQIRGLGQDLLGLLHNGSTEVPISFTGTCTFVVNHEIVTSNLSVKKFGHSYRLTMNQESLQVISWIMAEKLTAPEIELLALNPIKTPRLLQIRNDAQESARLAHERLNIIPEDAYRHVLWSYLLTKAYSPDFAKEVTDAHEQGITDNSETEHQMDYINNSVGRKYASQHYQRDELIDRLLKDPDVIRYANDRQHH